MSEKHSRIRQAIDAEAWLIQPEWLDTIEHIASSGGDLAAVDAQRDAMRARAEESGGVADLMPAGEMVRVGSTAIVPVIGPVVRYGSLFSDVSGLTSMSKIQRQLAEAKRDSSIERVVMFYDTPGGMVNGISETTAEIKNLGKPVVSYISHLGASLGYWLAVSGETVYAAPTAMVGSVGVRTPKMRNPDDDLVSTNAPKKRDTDDSRQARIDNIEVLFHQHVACCRKTDTDTVKNKFGMGDILLAPAALEVGMIDHITTLSELLGTYQTETPMKKDDKSSEPDQAAIDEAVNAALAAQKAEHETAIAALKQTHKQELDSATAGSTARIAAILDHEEAVGREAQARHLAFNTTMTAEDAAEVLKTGPKATTKATGTTFDELLATDEDPESAGDDSPDDAVAAFQTAWGNAA